MFFGLVKHCGHVLATKYVILHTARQVGGSGSDVTASVVHRRFRSAQRLPLPAAAWSCDCLLWTGQERDISQRSARQARIFHVTGAHRRRRRVWPTFSAYLWFIISCCLGIRWFHTDNFSVKCVIIQSDDFYRQVNLSAGLWEQRHVIYFEVNYSIWSRIHCARHRNLEWCLFKGNKQRSVEEINFLFQWKYR